MTNSSTAQDQGEKSANKRAERYIADGKFFTSFDEVEAYAASKGLRVTNTETIRRGTYVITLGGAR